MVRSKVNRKQKDLVFNDKIVRQTYRLTLLGYRDVDLATFFEVDVSTIEWWKRERPEFSAALNEGKALADSKVAEAMYQRAIGYNHPDTHFSTAKDADGNSIVIATPITKHHPPDVAAGKFWLTNRQRDRWADIQRTESVLDVTVKKESLAEYTDQELEFMKSIGMKSLAKVNPKNN